MMTLTMCGLLLGQRDGVSATEQRNAMLICWAGMALATMSKGLIGFVLPGTVLILYTLITRDWRLWTRLHFGKGLLLFFAITAPWFILIALKNPEHPHFFFIHEHFDRFTSGVHKRGGAWHYFFPLLAIGIIPWLGALIQGLLSGMKKTPTRFQPSLMLLIWAVFFFFFFSISGSKLPGYILPIFPALALLIAVQLEQSGSRSLQVAAILMVLLGLAGLLGVGKAIDISKDKPALEQALSAAYANWLYVVAALALLGGAVSWLLARKPGNGKDWAIIVLATSGYLLGQIAFLGHEPWGRYIAGSAHIPAIQKELVSATTPIYAVGRYEQALPFYLQRTVILVEFPDEMQFGLQQQPELWIPKREDFVAKWQAHQQAGEPAVAIMRDDVYDDLNKAGVAMRVIAQDPKRIIVAVPVAR